MEETAGEMDAGLEVMGRTGLETGTGFEIAEDGTGALTVAKEGTDFGVEWGGTDSGGEWGKTASFAEADGSEGWI